MKRWKGHRPSPALLIACVALFVALGGTVVGATKKIDGRTIRVKSLPGNRLQVGSLPGNRLKPGTIPGSRLAPGSVKGEQVDASSLAQVPSAAHADSADSARRAQTAIVADQADDATTINGRSVGCASTAREFAGACWDLRASTVALTAPDAASACADVGGELPDALALGVFADQAGISITTGGEWTKEVGNLGAPGVVSIATVEPDGSIVGADSKESRRFRCVTPLLA
ncbi:MAG TPA: hypothetical protein VMH33_12315 [Solirubrobacterales bacterium]|nr:hypothetical protein [Solirubrobacterales bacterium]